MNTREKYYLINMSSGDESTGDIYDEIGGIENDKTEEPLELFEIQEDNTEVTQKKDSDEEDQPERKVVKPKRIVKNPQPKFNEQTLKTPKGLPAIPGHFKRVKFKGKGHEEKDLNVLMKTYEYWCHRLFPRYPFEASIARLETLGTKKATVTQMKILRAGLELEEDKLLSDEEDIPATDGFVDQFDELAPRVQVQREPELSEEQQERMRQNRMRAEALRKQRLARTTVTEKGNDVSASTHNQSLSRTDSPEVHEEVDFDSILNTVNEDDPSSLETLNNIDKGTENNSSTRRKRMIDSSDDEMKDTQDLGSQKSRMICSDDEEIPKVQNKNKLQMIHSDKDD